MTREKAKEIISYHKHLVDKDKSGLLDKELEYQAIDMAIKALEQEPCEDAVSSEDVIKAVDHHTFDTADGLCLDEDISIILEALPPVTPTRKVGKWIGEKPYPRCSKCGCHIVEEYISCQDYAEIYKPMNYCPNCGAYMTVNTDEIDWLTKCRTYKHYYQVQADADEVRCRLKYCRFEPHVNMKEIDRHRILEEDHGGKEI